MDDASPRFRKDLEASNTEADGVACVDVRDTKSGTNFRFYDFEYQLALQFNGQPLRDLIAWASETYGVDLTVEGINEFAGRLAELGFLESGVAGAAAPTPAAADLTPAAGTSAPDLDNAEAEWMSAEGAKTATFIPDAAMLDAPADLTPVAPELPTLPEETDSSIDVATDEATPVPAPVPDNAKTAEMPAPVRLFDILGPASGTPAGAATSPAAPAPPAELTPPAAPPPAPAPMPGMTPATASPRWAVDLDGTLKSNGEAPTLRPLETAGKGAPAGGDAKTPRPSPQQPPAPAATPVPPGLPERRQPPTPDAVQMAAFSTDAAASAKPKSSTGRIVAVVIALLAIAGIGYVVWNRMHSRIPEAVRVRVLSPKPAAVYRWFSGSGKVTDHEGRTLEIESAGTLAELLPPGTAFAAGDILGRLRGAQPIEALLARQRARVAFYEQMRESMRAANNQPELRQAELKLAEKQRLIDESNASLAKLVVRATEAGEVVETLAKVGMPVKAHAPLVKVKGRVLHGEFEIDPQEMSSKPTFCRVEVIGLGPHASNAERPAGTAADVGSPDAQQVPRFVDCSFMPSPSNGRVSKVRVALPDNLGLVPGQPLRLARQRFDAVFPVPAAAVGGSDDRRAVWIASPAGIAERRDVAVADIGDDVLVSGGLRVGEEVIVEAPASLREGAAIVVVR
jgi:multidrug efflux pump subunit AcrA (membrane-fusion protein)